MKTDYSTDTLILGATFYGRAIAAAITVSITIMSMRRAIAAAITVSTTIMSTRRAIENHD